MPKSSGRQLFLEGLSEIIILNSDCENEDYESYFESIDSNNTLLDIFIQFTLQRYLEPREHVTRSSDFVNFVLHELDERRFRQEARMTKQCFQELVALVEGHSVFQNNSKNKQRPVYLQLLVALNRFGCFGNGAAIGRIALKFGLSGNGLHSCFLFTASSVFTNVYDYFRRSSRTLH
jgi:hypothetical protein